LTETWPRIAQVFYKYVNYDMMCTQLTVQSSVIFAAVQCGNVTYSVQSLKSINMYKNINKS
jgi:hypothetical protein